MIKRIKANIDANRVGFFLRDALMAGIGWLYFRDIIGVVILLPFAVVLQMVNAKRLILKKDRTILSQFRDLLISVSSSLSAGATLEGGFRLAPSEMTLIWQDKSDLTDQIRIMLQKIAMSIPIEKAISEMADNLKLEECERFSEVVTICKHSGGNMVNAVRACANALTEKLDAMFEIDIILAQRRMERNILVCVPHSILLMLMLMSPDYISLLYTTPYGRVAAVLSLAFSGIAWVVSEKIVDVKV